MNDAPSRLTRAVVSGTMWTFGASLFRAVLRLGTLAVLARLLDPVTFGLMAALTVVIQLAQTLGLIGLAPALIQKRDVTRRDLGTAQAMALALTASLAAVNLIAAGWIAALFREPALETPIRVISVIFLMYGFTAVARARMDRDLAFGRAARVEVLAALLGYSAVAITLAHLGFGLWALVGGQIAQAALSLLALSWYYPPVLSFRIDWAAARGLFRFGGLFSLGLLADRFAAQIDYLIVSRSLGAEALGFYSRAYQLMAGQARGGSQALSRVLFPALARLQDEPARLAGAYRRALAVAALPLAVASVFIWFLAEPIVLGLLGSRWGAAVEPFRWLGLALLPRGAARVNGALLKATGRVATFLALSVFYLAAVAGAAAYGVRFGIDGVAQAVTAALWLHYFVASVVTVRGQSIPPAMLVRGLQPTAVIAGSLALGLMILDLATTPVSLWVDAARALALGMAILLAMLFGAPAAWLGPDAAWIRAQVTARLRR